MTAVTLITLPDVNLTGGSLTKQLFPSGPSTLNFPDGRALLPLKRDGDCDPGARARAVVYVVAVIGVINIYIVVLVPRFRP